MSLRQIFSVAVAAFVFQAHSAAWGATYKVDPNHSNIGFTVKHNMISKVSGSFKEFEGTYDFDAKKPEASKVEFTAKSSSVNTSNDNRDAHLKKEDFFFAEKFPTLSFKSKSFKKAGKDKYKLEGDLTMRGVTKPVTFDVEYTGTITDMQGKERTGFDATTKVNRKDYGINWNKTLDKGGVVVSDDVVINLQIQGVKN
jgi:polyisoprenoid-binding protein YceI